METKPPITQACGVCHTSSWMLNQHNKIICFCCMLVDVSNSYAQELSQRQKKSPPREPSMMEVQRLQNAERSMWRVILERDTLQHELAAANARCLALEAKIKAHESEAVPPTAPPEA